MQLLAQSSREAESPSGRLSLASRPAVPQLSPLVSSFSVYVHGAVEAVEAVVVVGASVIVVDTSVVGLGLHAPAWTPEAARAATAKDLAEGIEGNGDVEVGRGAGEYGGSRWGLSILPLSFDAT